MTKKKRPGRYVVTGKFKGDRWYATDVIGRLSTDPAEAKVWTSVVAANHAAAALGGNPGGIWTVIPESMR